jgi:hypothetical protein
LSRFRLLALLSTMLLILLVSSASTREAGSNYARPVPECV